MRLELRARCAEEINACSMRPIRLEVLDFIEHAKTASLGELQQAYDFKPLRGHPHLFRLRIGVYRLGCRVDISRDCLILMRFMHREAIYKFFP